MPLDDRFKNALRIVGYRAHATIPKQYTRSCAGPGKGGSFLDTLTIDDRDGGFLVTQEVRAMTFNAGAPTISRVHPLGTKDVITFVLAAEEITRDLEDEMNGEDRMHPLRVDWHLAARSGLPRLLNELTDRGYGIVPGDLTKKFTLGRTISALNPEKPGWCVEDTASERLCFDTQAPFAVTHSVENYALGRGRGWPISTRHAPPPTSLRELDASLEDLRARLQRARDETPPRDQAE